MQPQGLGSSFGTPNSAFGNVQTSFGSSGSFGQGVSGFNTGNSPFGSVVTASFGQGPSQPALAQKPVAQTSAFSAFAQPGSNSSPFGNLGAQSAFGQASNQSPFGQAAQLGQSKSSPFGQASNQSQNAFGQSTNSAFAQPAQNPFAQAAQTQSPFGQLAVQSQSPFGLASTQSNPVNQNASNSPFGQSLPQNVSAFGQKQPNMFGSGSQQGSAFSPGCFSTGQSMLFGQQPGSATSQLSQSPFGAQANIQSSPFAQIQSQPFGSQQASASAFQQVAGASPFAQLANAGKPFTPYVQGVNDDPPPEINSLSDSQRAAFEAAEFTLGHIPEIVPPLAYR